MSSFPVSITRLVGVPGQAISTGVLVSVAPVDPHIKEMVNVGLLTFDTIPANKDIGEYSVRDEVIESRRLEFNG